MRPCIEPGCDQLHPGPAPRCPPHQRAWTRYRSTRQWRRTSRAARAEQPWCSICGATDDLVVDHVANRTTAGGLQPADSRSSADRATRGSRTGDATRGAKVQASVHPASVPHTSNDMPAGPPRSVGGPPR